MTAAGRESREPASHSSGIAVLLLWLPIANYNLAIAAPQTGRQAESVNAEQRNA
jgi:hypothetical protein